MHDGFDANGDHRFNWDIAGDPSGIEMRRLVAACNAVRWQNPALRSESLAIAHEDYTNQVLGFVRQAGDRAVWRHGVAFTAGVVLSFWALAGIMLALRAGGESIGWGFQLQSPGFVAVMALLLCGTLRGLWSYYRTTNSIRAKLHEKEAADEVKSAIAELVSPKKLGKLIRAPSKLPREIKKVTDKLDAYVQNRPISFYPWLRQIAEQRIIAARRRHLHAGRRTLNRQDPAGLPAESVLELAERLLAGDAPSAGLRRKEQKAVVRAALERLKDRDREVLVLRFLEELPAREVAEILGVTEGAVRVRMMRALQRLRDNLKATGDWS